MELRQLRYFVVLAGEGNYLNAAEELFVSQSQLSKKIMALEEELGVTLIDRSKRRISITDEGRILLEHAKDMLVSHEALIRELAEYRGLPPPALSIMSIPVLAHYAIPALLARFSDESPEIRIKLTEAEANLVLPALGRGEAELGLVREVFVDPDQFGFAKIREDEVVVVLPVSHRLAGRTSIDLAELKAERFVLPDKETMLYQFYLDLCKRKGIEPEIAHTSTRTENIIELIASGMGVSLMMRTVVEYLKNASVCRIPLADPVKSNFGIAWVKESTLSAGARKFLSFIRSNGA